MRNKFIAIITQKIAPSQMRNVGNMRQETLVIPPKGKLITLFKPLFHHK